MQTESAEPGLGAALREAREAAGKTVEQISSHTKIRATVIRDLEADRFGSSGGAVYARGHLKSIASALMIDPAPFLQLFDREQGQAAPPALLDQATHVPGPVTSFGGTAFAASAAAALTPERRGPRWGVALTGAAAVLLVIIGVGSLSSPSDKAPTALAASPTSTPAVTGQPVVQTPNPESVASKPPVTGAQLRLRLIGGNSWVSISSPAGVLFSGVLRDGEFKDFNDPTRLRVTVGNALAVNLNCGGRDSGPAGASGKVRRFACTAAGLTAL
ncbi:MAG: rane protein [Frankiales bacterium]|nr:rane protein [Frankiales bacterium]